MHEILNDYAKFTPTRDRQVLLKIRLELTKLCSFDEDAPISLRSECCLPRYCAGCSEKSRFVGAEVADSEMDRVTADARSDHHWQPRRQSSAW